MTGRDQIRNFIDDLDGYDDEQDVVSQSWYLPSHVVDDLRTFVIDQTGTTKHIGAVCTAAMRSWVRDEPTDDLHRAWSHLKHDYDYEELNVSEWSYRKYRDYTSIPKDEKSAVGFSAPANIVDEFTATVSTDEYGARLANAVECELLKRAQIHLMQDHIESGDAERTEDDPIDVASAPVVEVDEEGNRAEPIGISLDDPTAKIQRSELWEVVEGQDVDWECRRGLLAAFLRGDDVNYRKNTIKSYDEQFFDVSKRSAWKDFRAIVEQAKSDEDPLNVAPAQMVIDRIDNHHDLGQAMGLTSRTQPLDWHPYDAPWMFIRIYTEEDSEAWENFVDDVCSPAYALSEYEWDIAPDTIHKTYRGKHTADAVQKMLPALEETKSVLETQQFDGQTALRARVEACIEELEGSLADIPESLLKRYQVLVEKDITPEAREFRVKTTN